MNNKKSIKFKWESVEEYIYRITIYAISTNISNLLATLAKYEKQTNPDYQPCLNKIKAQHKKLINLKVPDLYKKPHDLLDDGYIYYERAFEILIEAFKSRLVITPNDNKLAGKVAKAASFIETGTAYTKIVNTKHFEIFEKKQTEYLKTQKEDAK